jgi:hypothetical protein
MKIRMLETTPGSIDGVRVMPYEAGAEYDLTGSPGERSLASAFVNAGLAEEVATDSADQNHEPESPSAPEQTFVEPAENKRQKFIKGK